ncbi:peptidase S12 [Lactiplantibacillus fabifermentans T30PCM01]|uniref:PbpX2 protein n=2 Tax=Lactiplantibacillus fabifermentans TaxID=483011 RepID=A0A0R2NM00_9LACO|nr:peptidase S12 [Lactiplantibacillus fabifermentans T30PCM01]KRO25691.1 pbpX2 protein [Lactiplantibacillus fabifermentans DSM 21115]
MDGTGFRLVRDKLTDGEVNNVKHIKLFASVLVGLAVIGGGAGYYVHYTNRVTATQQKKTAAKAKVKKAKRVQKKVAHQVAAVKVTKNKAAGKQITQILKADHFVGTALVVRNNKVLYRKGFGYANARDGRLNGPDSKYQILSIQKSITATLLMQLVQKHRLKLTDKVSKFYPSLPGAEQTTIRQMLDMTTGFRLAQGSTANLSEKQVVDYAVNHTKFTAAKLGKFNYSSVNYLLLAGIIRQLTGKTYQQVFTTNIIRRLKLKHTGFVIHGLGQHATTGYQAKTGEIKPTYDAAFVETTAMMNNELGTGQVYMSVGDLFKVEQAIETGKLITPKNVEILHTRTATGTYGGGVYNETPQVYRSHGLGYGYESVVRMSTTGKTGVVLLSNYYRNATSTLAPAQKIYTEMMKGNLK